MLSSSKFVVALHILTRLAHRRGHGPVSSKMIADSVGTNPVVIRRLMTALEGAALVNATAGRHGGFEARPRAAADFACPHLPRVEGKDLFKLHEPPVDGRCPVGRCIQEAISRPLESARQGLIWALARTNLAEIATRVAGLTTGRGRHNL